MSRLSTCIETVSTISAKPGSQAKSPQVAVIEVAPTISPEHTSNDDGLFGDPFLEDFYGSRLSDAPDEFDSPPLSRAQVEVLDIFKRQ